MLHKVNYMFQIHHWHQSLISHRKIKKVHKSKLLSPLQPWINNYKACNKVITALWGDCVKLNLATRAVCRVQATVSMLKKVHKWVGFINLLKVHDL